MLKGQQARQLFPPTEVHINKQCMFGRLQYTRGTALSYLERFTLSLSTPSSCTDAPRSRMHLQMLQQQCSSTKRPGPQHLAGHDLRPRSRVARHANQTPGLSRARRAARRGSLTPQRVAVWQADCQPGVQVHAVQVKACGQGHGLARRRQHKVQGCAAPPPACHHLRQAQRW